MISHYSLLRVHQYSSSELFLYIMTIILSTVIFLLSLIARVHSSAESSLRGNAIAQRNLNNIPGYGRYGCNLELETRIANPEAEDPEDCSANACGLVTFKCSDDWELNGLTEIFYSIRGLTPGQHALHVHQFLVGTDGEDTCTSTGGHWNPEAKNHGGNLNEQRHIGDLGNILADESGLAEGTLLAYVPLRGELGVRGKSVVVHAGTDDLGTGGDDGSRAVGNAGARPGCGNIQKSRRNKNNSGDAP